MDISSDEVDSLSGLELDSSGSGMDLVSEALPTKEPGPREEEADCSMADLAVTEVCVCMCMCVIKCTKS